MTPPAERSANKATHETSFGFAYINDLGKAALGSQPLNLPNGTIIVREKLRTPDGAPERMVVMIKREREFNPKANGWEFLATNGDATQILKREKSGECLKCHQSASGSDFVFPEDGRYR